MGFAKNYSFIIVGGWHVQPDCNLPSGEAFARQSLYASYKNYALVCFDVLSGG